jgi:hypothetical protein
MTVSRSQIIEFLRNYSLFRDLSQPQLDLVIDRLEETTPPQESEIYRAGTEANKLYFIFEGQVQLLINRRSREESFMILTAGDIFGWEAFSRGERYQLTAIASSPVVLLSLSYSSLTSLIHQMPFLDQRLGIRAESFMMSLRVPLSWRTPDETLYYISRRHPAFLWIKLLIPLMVGILVLSILVTLYYSNVISTEALLALFGVGSIIGIAWLLWNYVDWTNDYSIITSLRVVFQEKIVWLYDARFEALVSGIRSVDMHTDQIGLILGYGDVIVHTFAGDVILERLKHIKDVAQILEEQRRRTIRSIAQDDKSSFKDTMRQRLHPTEEPPPPEPMPDLTAKPRKPSKPVYYRSTRKNLFNMRFEENGVVTYRTHFILLIARLWFPILVLTGLSILSTAGLIYRPTILTSPTTQPCVLWSAGFLALAVIGFTLYHVEDWRNDIYIISDEKIVDRNKKPLGREELREANLGNIEAVRFERHGIFGLIFNFGTVYIRAGQAELTFDDVYNPSDVQREIFRRIAEREHHHQQEAMRIERDRVANWIEAYNEVVAEEQKQSEKDRGRGPVSR